MRSFLSLLVSFALVSLGDVANLAIANNISLAAIGVMGAYYTVNWLATEFNQFGLYTYRVERQNEWQYLQIALIASAAVGIAVTLLSSMIPHAFGIDDEQKAMLSSMLVLFAVHLPMKAIASASAEMLRLRGSLRGYRHGVILFYVGSIPLNIVLFFTWHNVVGVLIAQMFGNLLFGGYSIYKLSRDGAFDYKLVRMPQLHLAARYGVPLVGERLIQRSGLTVYGICASYLPADLYAIHSICLQAVYMGDIGDQAYSAALLVLVPVKEGQEGSRERYAAERMRMIVYRRKTAWVAVLLSFAASYAAAVIMHAEADLTLVAWFTFFYAFSFIPMCSSTPGKDFLTIQKHPVAVMVSTLCGVPFYMLMPIAAILLLPPDLALYAFGLTGTAQICIRALLYNGFIHKLDREHGVDAKKLAADASSILLEGKLT